jgi:hypothetical protein
MPGRFLMKALAKATVNLANGDILVLNPQHKTDNRARYPRVNDERDVNRLEKEGLAQRHTGAVPRLKGAKFQADPAPRVSSTRVQDSGRGDRGPTAPVGGPRQETDAEAEAAADEIEGGGSDGDDGTGEDNGAGGDPTRAPAA